MIGQIYDTKLKNIMKHLLSICLLCLIACSTSEEPEPIKLDSIVGEWTFKVDDVSGDMAIAEFSGELVVDDVGHYTIKNTQYNITKKNKVLFKTTPGIIESLFLLSSTDNYFSLRDCSINSSFTKITCQKYYYIINRTVIDNSSSKIILTRK